MPPFQTTITQPVTDTENVYQLAFVDLIFQFVNVLINIATVFMSNALSVFFSSLFGP